jgi:hypothetical protein
MRTVELHDFKADIIDGHIMEDRWYPYSSLKQHRKCLLPGCTYSEVRVAPKEKKKSPVKA